PEQKSEADAKPTAQTLQGVYGDWTDLELPDGSKIRARYMLVEASSVHPSHDPMTFKPSPDFPDKVQERDYEGSKPEQMKVINNELAFDARFPLANIPHGLDGPPTVTEKA